MNRLRIHVAHEVNCIDCLKDEQKLSNSTATLTFRIQFASLDRWRNEMILVRAITEKISQQQLQISQEMVPEKYLLQRAIHDRAPRILISQK
jgi:hypothetical protein